VHHGFVQRWGIAADMALKQLLEPHTWGETAQAAGLHISQDDAS